MDRELRDLERRAASGDIHAWPRIIRYWMRIDRCDVEKLAGVVQDIVVAWFREQVEEGLAATNISGHSAFDSQEIGITLENSLDPRTFHVQVYKECQIPLEEPVGTPNEAIQNTEMGNILHHSVALHDYFRGQPWCNDAFSAREGGGEWFYITDANVDWGFMQPQVVHDTWDILETAEGGLVIPTGYVNFSIQEIEDYVNLGQIITEDDIRERAEEVFLQENGLTADDLTDVIHDEQFTPFIEEWVEAFENPGDEVPQISEIQRVAGWGARLSAPGYMDATDWSFHETEDEAIAEVTNEPNNFTGDLTMEFILEVDCSLLLAIIDDYINNAL